MTSKNELIGIILDELRKAQTTEWRPPSNGSSNQLRLPPTLPADHGRQLSVTEDLLASVSRYSKLWLEAHSALRLRFKVSEFDLLARQAFGKILHSIDLNLMNDKLSGLVRDEVDKLLTQWVDQHQRPLNLTIGCDLLIGDGAYPIIIGPVRFDPRSVWLDRLKDLKQIPLVAARRIDAHWNKKPVRKRKNSLEAEAERAILAAIGDCNIVCTVETSGLSGGYSHDKGLHAARLAIMGVSLLWQRPSEALKWMRLHYDRRPLQQYTIFLNDNGFRGGNSQMAQLPGGRTVNAELISEIRSHGWLFEQIGEALLRHVKPDTATSRPKMMNALFLSLWWFHEACREPMDQIATTKFAASMDALAGGMKKQGIVKFIGARLGPKPHDKILNNGRTTDAVVDQIYNAGRSQMLHGSSRDFAQDWSEVRLIAEIIGRHCLVAACDWLSQNSGTDDVKALSIAGP